MNLKLNNDPVIPESLAHIETLVQRELRGRVRALRLSMRDGGLVLEGTTDSFYCKQLGQHAVMAVTALPILANDIVVLSKPPCGTSDSPNVKDRG